MNIITLNPDQTATEPGLYRMTAEQYRAVDAVNWSALKHIASSPKHYRHALTASAPDTESQRAGSMFHTALLEPEKFAERYAVLPADAPRRPSAAQWNAKKPSPDSIAAMEWWTNWNQLYAACEIVEHHEWQAAYNMANAVRTDANAGRYLAGAQLIEIAVIWRDPATGLMCKARPDLVARRDDALVLLDVKSCRPADACTFGARAAAYGYHCQLAHYRNGLAENGVKVSECGIISCESIVPHDVGVHWLDSETRALAHETVDGLLHRVAECTASGKWPGRYEQEQTLLMPAYMFGETLEIEYAD